MLTWACLLFARYENMLPVDKETSVPFPEPYPCPYSPSSLPLDKDMLSLQSTHTLNVSHFFSMETMIVIETAEGPSNDSSPPVMFDVYEVWAAVDWDSLQLVFICLDVLLLIYRLCHLYLGVAKLCHGFEETQELSTQEVIKAQEMHTDDTHAEQLLALQMTPDWIETHDTTFTENTMDSTQTTLKDLHSTSDVDYPPHTGNHAAMYSAMDANKPKANGDVRKYSQNSPKQKSKIKTSKPDTDCFTTFKRLLSKVIDKDIIPKLAIGSGLVVLCSIFLQLVQTYCQLDMFLVFSGFSPLLLNLDLHMDDANHFLELVAKQLTDNVLSWYPDHTKVELRELEGLLHDFKTGMHSYPTLAHLV